MDEGLEIWYIEYRDHAFHVGDPREVAVNPYILWAIGVVSYETENFIALSWYGSLTRDMEYPPEKHEIIEKLLIIKKILMGVIGELNK